MKKLVLSLLILSLVVTNANAISIAPIPIELKSGQRAATLMLEDTSDAEKNKVFEAKVFKWDPRTNEYTETNEVVIYPKASKLPASFKIGLKQRDFSSEKTYRIIVKEIHNQAEGINFVMSYDIPFFVRPFKINESVDVQCKNDLVIVKNTGNITVKVSEIDGQGAVVYIAPGDVKEVRGKKIKIKDKEYCNNRKEV